MIFDTFYTDFGPVIFSTAFHFDDAGEVSRNWFIKILSYTVVLWITSLKIGCSYHVGLPYFALVFVRQKTPVLLTSFVSNQWHDPKMTSNQTSCIIVLSFPHRSTNHICHFYYRGQQWNGLFCETGKSTLQTVSRNGRWCLGCAISRVNHYLLTVIWPTFDFWLFRTGPAVAKRIRS